jgi:hypothetical protein
VSWRAARPQPLDPSTWAALVFHFQSDCDVGGAADLMAVTWRKSEFRLTPATATSRARVELSLRRGCANLVLSLSHDHPYDISKTPRSATAARQKSGPRNGAAPAARPSERWARLHTRDALVYRLQECGITHRLVDERGTSSACPTCGVAAKKNGRVLTCTNPSCHLRHHRDIAGAQNMVRKTGLAPTAIAHTEHRRVGTPARRDRRRHLLQQQTAHHSEDSRNSCLRERVLFHGYGGRCRPT